MANVKITELTAATALAGTDVLPIVDVGADATKKVSVSDLLRNLPDGTASAPALAFADDQNTGVLSPGDNSLAFATSGTQRLVIDSSGRVGIGTTSPSAPLAFGKSDYGDQTSEDFYRIKFKDFGGIANDVGIGQPDENSIAFNIQGGSTSSYRWIAGTAGERMRLDGNGNVGIGTTSPDDILDVRSGAAGFSQFVHASGDGGIRIAGTGASSNANLVFSNDHNNGVSDEFTIQLKGNNDRLAFRSGGPGDTERVSFMADGKVGIGESSPDTALHVKGTASSQLTIERDGTGSQIAGIIFKDGSGDQNRISCSDQAIRFAYGSGNAESMRIDSSGRLLVGTSSALDTAAGRQLQVSDANGAFLILGRNDTTVGDGPNLGGVHFYGNDTTNNDFTKLGSIDCSSDGVHGSGDNPTKFTFSTTADGASSPTERMRIDSSGNVIVGTSSTVNPTLRILGSSAHNSFIQFADGDSNNVGQLQYSHSSNALITAVNGSERMRIDSSGRLLVGTSTNLGLGEVQIPDTCIYRQGNASSTGQNVGVLKFGDTRPGEYAQIRAEADNTPGANDFPGRLLFSTTGDGASSPTERMRLTSGGDLLFGKTGDNFGTAGAKQKSTGALELTADGAFGLAINRLTNDGELVRFYQATTQEGSITVSGTTVSYNGAHLSRWSQLASGAARSEILRGSVLSNLDEMCEWGEEDNEQLNRMKVSDVEGDVNVAGVFQNWDDDDDTYTNDLICAMTGDFVIRIAQGTTVARGDLLMSAGDGTAKPQDDDIVRSKTIAKVTSTTVSTTYADGSYCVPCVLMAC